MNQPRLKKLARWIGGPFKLSTYHEGMSLFKKDLYLFLFLGQKIKGEFMKKILRKITGLLALGLALSACGASEGNDKKAQSTQEAQVSEKTNKDELVLGLGSEPEKGFDPIYESSHSQSMIFHSALFKRDIDLHITEDLAESSELSDDKMTYTITLKDGLKFADGSDLKASDVAFTYNKAKEEAAAGINLERFEKAQALDDKTVKLTLKEPDMSFTSTLASLGIVPEASYSESYGQNPVGSGPFKLVEWKKGQELIVEPNENYHGDKAPFKKITFLFFKDDDQALASASEGICDIVRIPYTAKDMDAPGFHPVSVKTIDNRGISLPYVPDEGKVTGDDTIHPGSPIGNDVTSDITIRKALNIAMDRQEIIDHVLNGEATKATSIADGLPWYNEETSDMKDGDIEGAKKILDEAGWVEGADGIREKDGVRAKFDLYYAYQDRENLAVYFTEKARQLGIEVESFYGDWDFVGPNMYSQAVLFGWGGYDPLDMYYSYSSKYQAYDYYNTNYYENSKVDDYFEKGLTAGSLDEMYDNFKKAQWDGEGGFSWMGDCTWVWLVNENHVYLVRDGLDIGEQKIEPHSSRWTIMDTVNNWKWEDNGEEDN